MYIILVEWRDTAHKRQIKVWYRDGVPAIFSTEEAAQAEANHLARNTKTKYSVVPYTPQLTGFNK